MYTRKQYLNKECTHSEYYSQLVSANTLITVGASIGSSRIINSEDSSFKDIPLKEWDQLHVGISRELLESMGESMTLSCKVCICKEAARQIKEAAINGGVK